LSKPSLIYLASPYSHLDPAIREARFRAVCHVASKLMAEGMFVFSPIAHTHCIAQQGDLPTGWEYWREFDTRMIMACDELWVLMLPGWRESAGLTAERQIASQLQKRIRFMGGVAVLHDQERDDLHRADASLPVGTTTRIGVAGDLLHLPVSLSVPGGDPPLGGGAEAPVQINTGASSA